MENNSIESKYNIDFRKDDTKTLAQHITHNHSVELVGMKRVGISNFLRFFLTNPEIYTKHFKDNHQLFIVVDLNDLIEREIFPFWRLTFKRILDAVENSKLDQLTKQKISQNFLTSIQTGDLFLTIDGIRDSLIEITNCEVHPTIFFVRFDRIIDAASKDFFNNLQGLIEATSLNLSYIFTSDKRLSDLSPSVFDLNSMNAITHPQFLQCANKKDTAIMQETLLEKYEIKLSREEKDELIRLSGGHFQYLNYSVISVKESKGLKYKDYLEELKNDERIQLQSEEIFSTLNNNEQVALLNFITSGESKYIKEMTYLTDSAIISNDKIFSPLFEEFLKEQVKENQDKHKSTLTNKEHLLFETLKAKTNEICSREEIVKFVWPEYSEYGVSDWSIDRLVARLRKKLQLQNSEFSIETIRTRGFKLIK